jgi:hypothetical protein
MGIELNTMNLFCPPMLKMDQFHTEEVLTYMMYIDCLLCGKKLRKILMLKRYVGGCRADRRGKTMKIVLKAYKWIRASLPFVRNRRKIHL